MAALVRFSLPDDKGEMGIGSVGTTVLRVVIDYALPPRCPGCGVPVAADHRFCAACWTGLRFIAPPWCATCNLPFAYDRGAGAQCGHCLSDPPDHDGVRAAVAYGDVPRALALRLKYGGQAGAAATMAASMHRLLPAEADLLVPVPLHRCRLWSRGYNQAALIADRLADLSGLPVNRSALVRTHATPPLRGHGRKARAKGVRGAFAVAEPAAIAGRAVVLIDDVYTSGATTDACVRVLRRAGATGVTILCFARVLNDAAD